MMIPRLLRHHFNAVWAILLLLAAPAEAWGPQGHRVAGTLTEAYLSPAAQRAVQSLLGDESLSAASTWADRMRGNPSVFWQQTAGPYHYVTVPQGKTYAEVGAPGQGDAYTALAEFRSILEDPSSSRAHRQLALRFSLHIIQDLHQPLHVGSGRDRGGNDIKLRIGAKTTNLHRVWDSGILAVAGRSDDEWTAHLQSTAPEDVSAWADPDPLTWISESAALRDRVYPSRRFITDQYLQHWLPAAEQRLQQSAVRAAAWLNQAFDE